MKPSNRLSCRAFEKHELVSSDLDIIRQVLVKDFSSFSNRTVRFMFYGAKNVGF